MFGTRWVLVLVLVSLPLFGARAQEETGEARDFRIGVDDVLAVSVWELDDLDQVVTVRPDGKVSLQLLGDVRAEGLSVSAFTRQIQERYRPIVEGANVTVTLREMRSSVVYFVGEFKNAGTLPLTREMTLLQAIAVMGGFTADADPEAGYVLRGEQVIAVDLRVLMREPDPELNVALLPGDTVVVPSGEWTYIQGEVRSPGLLRFKRNLTVLGALAEAGGLTEMARPGRVFLLRGKGERKLRIEVDVDVMLSESGDVDDVALEPGDILTVPQRIF